MSELKEYWTELYPDGMTEDEIANELNDYEMILDGLNVLYDRVTGGRASKANTDKDVIIALFEDHVNEIVEDALAEERGEQ